MEDDFEGGVQLVVGEHPGPASAALPRAIADAIVAQARAEYPNEACGVDRRDRGPGRGR